MEVSPLQLERQWNRQEQSNREVVESLVVQEQAAFT
jgi:hypothetical protein